MSESSPTMLHGAAAVLFGFAAINVLRSGGLAFTFLCLGTCITMLAVDAMSRDGIKIEIGTDT